jgi:hypothetical protein
MQQLRLTLHLVKKIEQYNPDSSEAGCTFVACDFTPPRPARDLAAAGAVAHPDAITLRG